MADTLHTAKWIQKALLPMVAGALFFLFADPFLSPPDCASYWAWAQAISGDLSLNFAKIYEAFEMPMRYVYLTPTGRLSNDWPMGTGLLLAPVAWAGRSIAHAYMLLVMAVAVVFWWRITDASRAAKICGCVALVVATPLLFYGAFGPFFSHGASFAFTTLFLCYWIRTLGNSAGSVWLTRGVLLGFAALMRPQNVLLGVVLAAEIPAMWRALRQGSAGFVPLRNFAVMGLGAVLGFAPQMVAYAALNGHPLALPKVDEMQWLAPNLYEMFLSDFHGVLPWTPVYALAIVGLCVGVQRAPVVCGGLLAAWAAQVYLNAANEVWWAGGSFGNRRLADSACIVGFGVVMLWEFRRARGWQWGVGSAVALCALWTTWLLLAERRGALPLDRYVPFDTQTFLPGLLATVSAPMDTFRAMARPMLQPAESLIWRGVATMLLVVGLALLQFGATKVGGLSLKRKAIFCVVWALILISITAASAWRTPPVEDDALRKNLAKESRILWDNYIELSYYRHVRREYEAAIIAARKAARMLPSNYSGFWYLAIALDGAGRRNEAKAAFAEVLRLNPTHPRADALRNYIASP